MQDQTPNSTRVYFIHHLLASEHPAVTRLMARSHRYPVITPNRNAHEVMADHEIPHQYFDTEEDDWSTINTQLYNRLCSGNSSSTLDTWSHWLVSEINLAYLIATSILEVVPDSGKSEVILKHSLDDGSFQALSYAVAKSSNRVSRLIEWDCDVG